MICGISYPKGAKENGVELRGGTADQVYLGIRWETSEKCEGLLISYVMTEDRAGGRVGGW